MAARSKPDLTPGDLELLVDGLSDDIAFVWVLIHLGLRSNPPVRDAAPMAIEVEEAFAALGRLSDAGLIRVGRIEYVDDGPPGRVAPVKHVVEQLDMVKARVRASCLRGKDWEWSCWVVNTTDGDAIARRSLEGGSLRSASEEA